eukprot:Hpha_TRINITY_DN32364_c0_g1::TRINITY_DN32364_c0_g1_i1::g.145731::m.145731
MSAPKRRRADTVAAIDVDSDAESVLTCDTASSVDLDEEADVDQIIEEAFTWLPADTIAVVLALAGCIGAVSSSVVPRPFVNGGVYLIGGVLISFINDGIQQTIQAVRLTFDLKSCHEGMSKLG